MSCPPWQLAVPRVNPDRCPVHESPARMSTYRHARRVLRPNRIKETSRSSHERGHAYTQMSWSRCCHVAAGCALSMRWQSHKGSAVAADQPCLTHAPTYPHLLASLYSYLSHTAGYRDRTGVGVHDLVSTERIACCYLGNGGWDQQPTTTMTTTMTTPTPPWRECTYILCRCLSYLDDDCSADLRR